MTDETFRWALKRLVTVGFDSSKSDREREIVSGIWPSVFAQRCRTILAERDALKAIAEATPEVRAVMYFELSRQAKRLWFSFGLFCGGCFMAGVWILFG